jgi:16S rRNA processing protein RimM
VGAELHPEETENVLTIAEAAPVADGPGWWLRFREAPTREAAEALVGTYLEIPVPDEPREPGRWYFHELEGLAVRATDGRELGTVREVYRAGGAEVLLVRGDRGELDVPLVRGIVTDLAPERGEVLVDLEALDLDARPVDDPEYVRPRDRRPRARGGARRRSPAGSRATGGRNAPPTGGAAG